jgi:DNA-3-methyladenine glycosylase
VQYYGFDLNFCSDGPSKICRSFGFDMSFDGIPLKENNVFVIDDGYISKKVVKCKRINIEYAGEWAEKEFRFCVAEKKQFLSRPF